MLEIEFDVESWSKPVITLMKGGTGHSLYLKFKESDSDEDFETFVDYVRDAIADAMDFEVTALREIS